MKKILTLMLALVLVFSLVACSKDSGKTGENTGAEATTHTASVEGYAGPIEISVTREGDKITKVEVTSHSETPEIGGKALEQLVTAVEKAGTTEGVDVVAGATVTSEAFLSAVKATK